MERVILHSDINNCYASVECLYDASLRGKPVAVGGSVETRHGIVLAKSEQAKRCGVKTGDALWQAREKCHDLVVVPPHFERYKRYSELVRGVYRRYTDQIEPFGLDEAWLDVTDSQRLLGAGGCIADDIRRTVQRELGLTVSVGVSFNKIFAKLGSDMKKPNAVTVIDKQDFREKIWNLPVGDMLGCGRSTVKKLSTYGVRTIGQLAACDRAFLKALFGKMGDVLWSYANGLDASRVQPDGYLPKRSDGGCMRRGLLPRRCRSVLKTARCLYSNSKSRCPYRHKAPWSLRVQHSGCFVSNIGGRCTCARLPFAPFACSRTPYPCRPICSRISHGTSGSKKLTRRCLRFAGATAKTGSSMPACFRSTPFRIMHPTSPCCRECRINKTVPSVKNRTKTVCARLKSCVFERI